MPNSSSTNATTADLAPLTVHQLRRLWKPHKERLAQAQSGHPTSIRIHRALSWMQRIEQLGEGEDLDFAILGQWIAFNALYGQWDPSKRQPVADRESWRRFIDCIFAHDRDHVLQMTLVTHKRLVLSLLEDAYLSSHFWQEPTPQRASRSKKAKYDAATWYLEGRWIHLLDQSVERVYLLRCQLMHGAATYGGRLNRTSLRRCSLLMGWLLPAFVQVIADFGADAEWGPMCYPPLR